MWWRGDANSSLAHSSVVSSISSVPLTPTAVRAANLSTPSRIPLEIFVPTPERPTRTINNDSFECVSIRSCWKILIAANLLGLCASIMVKDESTLQNLERIRRGIALGALGLYTWWQGRRNLRLILSSIAVCLVALCDFLASRQNEYHHFTFWRRVAYCGCGIVGDIVTSLPHTMGSTSRESGRMPYKLLGSMAVVIGLVIQATANYRLSNVQQAYPDHFCHDVGLWAQHSEWLGEIIAWTGIFVLNASSLVESKVIPKGSMFLFRRIRTYRRMALAFLGPLLLWTWLSLRATGTLPAFGLLPEPGWCGAPVHTQGADTTPSLMLRVYPITNIQYLYEQIASFSEKVISVGIQQSLDRIIDYARSVDFIMKMNRLALLVDVRQGYQRLAVSTPKQSLVPLWNDVPSGPKMQELLFNCLEDKFSELSEDTQAKNNHTFAARTAASQTDKQKQIQQRDCQISDWLKFAHESSVDLSLSGPNSSDNVDDGATESSIKFFPSELETEDSLQPMSDCEVGEFKRQTCTLSSCTQDRISNADSSSQDPETAENDVGLCHSLLHEGLKQLEQVEGFFPSSDLQYSELCEESDSFHESRKENESRDSSKDKNRSRRRRFPDFKRPLAD